MTDYLRYYYEQKEAIDARIAADTEKHRKADAVLRVTDAAGKPLRASVTLKQTSHSFQFGCNIFMLDQFPDEEHNAEYRRKFPELFNYAIVPFYWSDYEVEEGKPRVGLDAPNVYRRPAPEKVLQYTKEHRLGTKGHCLMWQLFLPEWLTEDKEQNMRYLERRISQIAKEYGDRIPDFDIVNETISRKPYHVSEPKIPFDCPNRTFAYADSVMPNNRLFINDTTKSSWCHFNREHSGYYLHIENLLLKGRRIDAIGMQYHIFVKPEDLEKDLELYLNPTRLLDSLDYYGRFERPIHISEITVPAYADRANSNEEQAEIAELLYRLWFSHPSVEAIIWWNLVDGTAAYAPLGTNEGENYYRGGLLNYDMTEKPVYQTLKRLIKEEWTTALSADVFGDYRFRGFCGDYDVTVTTPDGKTHNGHFALSGTDGNEWVMVCQ